MTSQSTTEKTKKTPPFKITIKTTGFEWKGQGETAEQAIYSLRESDLPKFIKGKIALEATRGKKRADRMLSHFQFFKLTHNKYYPIVYGKILTTLLK
jgi:hypothetical protein